MKRSPLLLIGLGLLIVAAGLVLSLTGGPPAADPALAASCHAKLVAQGADAGMLAQCRETAFASSMTATDAESAARAISAANNQEIGGNTLAMFLIGLGAVLAIAGLALRLKTR